MAGYHLYLKDSTFLKLIQKAGGEGISMGRFLNDILNEYAEKLGNPHNSSNSDNSRICEVCGAPATRRESPRYVCNLHRRKGASYTVLGGRDE